jgi:hypothetical protein
MTILAVNRLCRDVMRDLDLRRRLAADPEAALAASPYAISAAERAALLAGDVGTLYRMGANSFLMGYLARYKIFGLDTARYGERMRAVDDLPAVLSDPLDK